VESSYSKGFAYACMQGDIENTAGLTISEPRNSWPGLQTKVQRVETTPQLSEYRSFAFR